MMSEIKKINKISIALAFAVFYAVVGFFIASFSFIFSLSSLVIEDGSDKTSFFWFLLFNIALSILFGIAVSVLTAIVGFAIGFLVGLFYNIYAFRLGGVKIELSEVLNKKKDVLDNCDSKKDETSDDVLKDSDIKLEN